MSNTNKTINTREQWLDLIKGMIIFLVVLIHVMQGILVAGYGLQCQTLFNWIFALTDFAMPLFFAVSGYLYTREQPSNWTDYKTLVSKKLVRLGIPYLIFSLLQGVLRMLLNGQTNLDFGWEKLLALPIQPFDQFWFLYALFLIFCLAALLDIVFKNDRIVLLILFIIGFTPNHMPLACLMFAAANCFYFYLGVWLKRYGAGMLNNQSLLLIGGAAYILSRIALGYEIVQHLQIISIFLAISGSMLTFYICRFVIAQYQVLRAFFNNLGVYSFEIYLLHVLPASATRMFLVKVFHIDDLWIHLGVGMTMGILIPIGISLYAKKLPALEFCFYPGKYFGQKARQTSKPIPA